MIARVFIVFLCLVFATGGCGAKEAEWNLDPVTGEPLLNEEAQAAIGDLEAQIKIAHDKFMMEMANDVRLLILKCESPELMDDLPLHVQEWLHEIPGRVRDEGLSESIVKVRALIKVHGDDIGSILRKTFWARLQGKPLMLDQGFFSSIIYWRENATPEVTRSPQGMGKVDWI